MGMRSGSSLVLQAAPRLRASVARRGFSSGVRQMLREILERREEEQEEEEEGGKAKRKVVKKPSMLVEIHKDMVAKSRSASKQRPPAQPPPPPHWIARQKWGCVKGCGACCRLEKGPDYPPVEEVFTDPADVALYKNMIGKDGWCKHYNKTSRQCTIYKERPRFCRVEPAVFEDLFGLPEDQVDKEACRLCRDSISGVYGCKSLEMKNFERLIANFRNKS